VIDLEGYRENVGIILNNRRGQVLWARRICEDSWQFPQGGILENETPEEAMYRELHEEVGLQAGDVAVIAHTQDWLRYRLPKKYIRRNSRPLCIGQKQIWFMLEFVGDESRVKLDCSDQPEFDSWCWVNYWQPLEDIVSFKRKVYERALGEFSSLVLNTE